MFRVFRSLWIFVCLNNTAAETPENCLNKTALVNVLLAIESLHVYAVYVYPPNGNNEHFNFVNDTIFKPEQEVQNIILSDNISNGLRHGALEGSYPLTSNVEDSPNPITTL